jgi:hypothetical protein
MYPQKGYWSPASLLRQTVAIAVVVVMAPVVALVQIPLWVLGLQHAKRTPEKLSPNQRSQARGDQKRSLGCQGSYR